MAASVESPPMSGKNPWGLVCILLGAGILSVWTCYLLAGVSLMMLLLPFSLSFTSWQGLWRINGIVLFLYGIMLFKATAKIPFVNPSHTLKLKTLGTDILKTITSPAPLLLALIFVTYTLQWLAVMGFLPTLLLEEYGFSRALASWLTAGMVCRGLVPGQRGSGWNLTQPLSGQVKKFGIKTMK